MSPAGNLPYDTLTVTKGPEDGISFPLTTSPLALGRDPTCEVTLRLNVTVQPFQARVSVAKHGYRVRRLTSAPVYVDGHKCGWLRSRGLRAGQVVKLGYSELLLSVSSEGLSATGRSKWWESDAGWTLRMAGRTFNRFALWILGRLGMGLRAAAGHWFIVGIGIVIVLAVVLPGFREFLQTGWEKIIEAIRS